MQTLHKPEKVKHAPYNVILKNVFRSATIVTTLMLGSVHDAKSEEQRPKIAEIQMRRQLEKIFFENQGLGIDTNDIARCEETGHLEFRDKFTCLQKRSNKKIKLTEVFLLGGMSLIVASFTIAFCLDKYWKSISKFFKEKKEWVKLNASYVAGTTTAAAYV